MSIDTIEYFLFSFSPHTPKKSHEVKPRPSFSSSLSYRKPSQARRSLMDLEAKQEMPKKLNASPKGT